MFALLTGPAWVTLGVVLLMLVALVREVARPDLILLAALGALLVTGVLTPEEAFAGLSNPAVLTVGALFVVAAGVHQTGALAFVDRLVFTRSRSVPAAILRLMTTTAVLSAFLNNTPLVAMLMPRVQAWCQAAGVSPSKLMIPLSYAAIVGGMATLIGTSTNLLVDGLLRSSGYAGLGLFDLAWVAVPAAVAAILYFALVGHRFLPDRGRREALKQDLAGCLFEVRVAGGSPLVGQTVEEAGLRALGDAYLVHLWRAGDLVPSAPELTLRADDRLVFLGTTAALDALLQRPGLERPLAGLPEPKHATLPLFEAVVAPTSQLVGRTLREVEFREHYHGIVLGVQRRDAVVSGSLGRLEIEPGDLLLVEAANGFDRQWNARRDEFYVVAPHRPSRSKPQPHRAPLALLILVSAVGIAAFGWAPLVVTAFIGALAMIGTRCIRGRDARRSVEASVLIVIAAALGIGKAIENAGLADAAARLVGVVAEPLGPVGVIAVVFVATSLLTEIVTNNAAAALMLVVALAVAEQASLPPEAFAVTVAVAASASFLTPIGYQTNMMVMAAGAYRFSDYVRTGAVVNVLVTAVSILMIWLVWL